MFLGKEEAKICDIKVFWGAEIQAEQIFQTISSFK